MTDDQKIRDKLAKIKALFAGASSDGERQAAQAAIDRIHGRIGLGEPQKPAEDPPVEFRFSLANHWSMRLFLALCRSKGYRPFRRPRMRHTSVCVLIGAKACESVLWPEYSEMNRVLTEHLNELANRIIADCINPDRSEPETVTEPPPLTGTSVEMSG